MGPLMTESELDDENESLTINVKMIIKVKVSESKIKKRDHWPDGFTDESEN